MSEIIRRRKESPEKTRWKEDDKEQLFGWNVGWENVKMCAKNVHKSELLSDSSTKQKPL